MRLENHELWPYLSRLFPGDLPVRNDGTFSFQGRDYLLSPSPYEEGEPFVYHFHTYYYPKQSRFSFAQADLVSLFGPLKRHEIRPSSLSSSSSSLLGKALRAFYAAFGVPPTPTPNYLPPVSSKGEVLAGVWSSSAPLVPSLWFVGNTLASGFLVAASHQGEMCLAHVLFSSDGEPERVLTFDEGTRWERASG